MSDFYKKEITNKNWVFRGIIFLCLLFLINSTAVAGQLVAAEYFVDTDPGAGMGTPIATTADGGFDTSTESVTINLSGASYSEGQHKIYVRFKDADGNWGPAKGQIFQVREDADFTYALSKGEYYIDTDPGEGNGQPLTAEDGTFDEALETVNNEITLDGLSDGPHKIFTRFQDNTGNWGAPQGFQFMVQSSEEEDLVIQSAEYFINTDPGEGAGTPIAAPKDGAFDEQVEELEASFNVSGLGVGRHYAYFRVRASNGRWGPARGVPFQVENIVYISEAEYFFDSDPGEGSGTPITVAKDGNFDSDFEEVDLDIDMSETGLDVGLHTMYFRFKNSKGEWSQTSSKQINVQTRPAITLSADTLQFGEPIVVGDSLTQTFTVGNDGDGALNITNITSSSAEFTVSETTGSIPANSSDQLTFTVTYKPTTAGEKNAVLTIANNDQNKTIRLLGEALAKEPIMMLSTTSLDYETVLVGDSVSSYVAVYNTGYDTLKLSNISVNSSQFRVTPTSGTLRPQSSFTDSLVINVALVPDSEGNKTGTLTIGGNVANQTVSLSGTAQLNPQPTIALNTDSLSFGAVEIGKDSIRTLQIRNLGTNTLTVSSVSVMGSAFAAPISTPVNIERGTPLNVPVTFSPATASSFSGSITINSNDASKGSVEVVFSGEGTTGPPTRILTVNPSSLDFGQVTKADTAKQVLTLSNEGNATLKVTVIASDASDFFVQNGPKPANPIFIPAESSKDVEVSFSPSAGGSQTFNGELAISSDRTDNNDPEIVSMTGVGVDQPTPNIQLSTRTLDFGELRLDNSESLSFTITNGGNAALVVSGVVIDNAAFSLASSTSTAFTLTQGQEREFTVNFEPTQVQEYSASLTISSNIDPVSLDLVGEGVTLSAGVDSVEVRSNTDPVTRGEAVPVTISPTGLGSNGSAHIYYKAGGGGAVSSYTRVAMQVSNTGAYSASIPSNLSSEKGISYWFEVSDGTETVTSPSSNPHLNPYGIMVEIPDGLVKNSPQPAGSGQNFYRLISVPMNLTAGSVDTVLKNFGPADDTSWRLFRWQSGSYIEHSESGFESFAPGRGYWFITTTAASIQTGGGTSARTDEQFSVFLQPGWNMIGSPFTYSTSWDNADVPVGVENLWAYDGSGFTNSSILSPWEGYFVNNTTNNPVELKLSPVETGAAKLKEINAVKHTLAFDAEEGWSVQIAAKSGIVEDEYNFAGVQLQASDGQDNLDLRDAPKQPGEYLQVAFIGDDEQRRSVDMRQVTSSGQYWDFDINTNSSAESITIDLSVLGELPGDFKMQLIDKDQQTLWNLESEEDMRRTIRTALGDSLTREFRLVVGTDAFLSFNNLGISETPESFVLKNNYPNPFNPSTTIVFGLPEASDVTLEIYNSIGRKVATVINKRMEAGYHNFIWDASRVASGVYFYRMVAKGSGAKSTFTKIQKMTLIK